MKTLAIISIIVLFLFSSTSCDPCMHPNCVPPFYFQVVDRNQNDLVFGTNPVYTADSVYLELKGSGNRGYSSMAGKKFRCNAAGPVDTFYLHLTSSDTDTLLMDYHLEPAKCCYTGRGEVIGIKYNGLTAKKVVDTFTFVK